MKSFSHNIIKGLMITSLEGLKVVHLIRAPRARAVSCIANGQAGPVTIPNYKKYFTLTCNRIMKVYRYGVEHLAKKGQYKGSQRCKTALVTSLFCLTVAR